MGFFDKISQTAKEMTENAKKVASEAIDSASKTAKELSDKASKEFTEISDKTSVEGSYYYDKISGGISSLSETVGTSVKDLTAWAESMPDNLRKMADDFDANAMWDKLSKTATKAGQDLIVMVLTIYYSIESKIKELKK